MKRNTSVEWALQRQAGSAPRSSNITRQDSKVLVSQDLQQPSQINKEKQMSKAYWVSTYRAVKNADKVAAYAKLAGPALSAAGGRFLARGMPSMAYELGLKERTVLIEFDSVEQATAAHDGPGYQAALAALDDGADRDIRIIEGV